jgi:hypothetical protein
LARAKNTTRAEARRRYRDQVRTVGPEDAIVEDETLAATPPQSSGLSSMFRMPDVRADLRALPEMFRTRKRIWIPFAMLGISFVLALMLSNSILPDGVDRLVSVYVELTLPPTSLFVFFIGGFLAPRASYLVGAILGLVDGILWSTLFLIAPGTASETQTGTANGRAVAGSDVIAIILVAVVVGILAAGFAAWYRNFLRQSQERARQNRVQREQQQQAKAKADARAAKDAQRQAAKTR